MFREPRPNVIESDNGFSVEVLGRTGIRYSEEGMVLFIDSEVLAGPSGIVLFTQNMRKEKPKDSEDLSDKEKSRIVANVRDAFKFKGFDIQIV